MRASTARMLLVVALSVTCRYGHAASVSFTEVPGTGRFHGINASGQIVGTSLAGDGLSAFLYANGIVSSLFASNAGVVETEAYGISLDGTIVGSYTVAASQVPTHGFSFVRGTVTTIDYPGAKSTVARGVNDAHTIVGYYRDLADGRQHGFIYDRTNFTPINVPGAVNTFATGINNSGSVVGYYTALGSDGQYHDHGFLYDHSGQITTIDVSLPGQSGGSIRDTRCYAINDPGIIVGLFVDVSGTHGFVDSNGSFLGVDAPGTPPGVGTFIDGINDQGQLAIHGATNFIGKYVP